MTRPRVLIADDQQPILDWLDQQLRDEFQIVAACADGSAALEAAMALQPDALVLDISMPRMSGLAVARRLSALPNPPRIIGGLRVAVGSEQVAHRQPGRGLPIGDRPACQPQPPLCAV